MKFSQTQKLILALVIFAIAGFIIYNSFFGANTSTTTSSGSSDNATTTISAEGQYIIDVTSKIDAVSIDLQLFSSPLFLGLTDFDVAPSPEAQGRPNPFANIGNDTGSSVTSVATSSKSIK